MSRDEGATARQPDAEDRGWHAPGAELGWSDSVGFRFVDPATRTGVVARLGVRPNEGAIDVGIDVFMSDGSFVATRQIGPWQAGGSAAVEGFEIRADGSEECWRLVCDGAAHSLAEASAADQHAAWHGSRVERLILELTWTATGEPRLAGGSGRRFSQPGRIQGEMWVSGDHFVLDVVALRDRSWGPDRLDPPHRRARLCALADGPGAFEVESIEREGNAASGTAGWLVRNGDVQAVTGLELVEDATDKTVERLRATIAAGGEDFVREGRVLALAPLPGRRNDATFLLRECLVEWAGPEGLTLGFAELLTRT